MKSPGYRTWGFWGSLGALIVTGVLASDAVAETGNVAKGGALLLTALAAAGYSVARGRFKEGDPSKPAWKQTEFWLSVGAVVVSVLLASGAFSDGGTVYKVLAGAAAILAAMGYGKGQSYSAGSSGSAMITGPLK